MFLLNFYRPCEIILSYEAFEILVPGKGGGGNPYNDPYGDVSP